MMEPYIARRCCLCGLIGRTGFEIVSGSAEEGYCHRCDKEMEQLRNKQHSEYGRVVQPSGAYRRTRRIVRRWRKEGV